MSQHATITGPVTYTPGDGAPLPIPLGPVDLEFAPDSVTLSWTDDNHAAGLTAIPRDEFDRFVREGSIRLSAQPA